MLFWHDLFFYYYGCMNWYRCMISWMTLLWILPHTIHVILTWIVCCYFFSWRWLTHDDDVVNGEYYHLTTHVVFTWIVLLWLHWLIHLHDIKNYIVVNITTYNSRYFDMNCIFVDVMNCWNYHLTTHVFFTLIVWCGIRAFYIVSLFAFVVINYVCNGDVLHELFNTCHAVI